MSFDSYEQSRAGGEPATLYYIRYGEPVDACYAYTDAEQVVEVDGVAYQPTAIQRGSITTSGKLDKAALELLTPDNVELAELFRVYPPTQVTTLIIRQGHLADPDADFPVVWMGRILSCAREGSEARFTCEPVSTSMRRPGLRRHYQLGCPHALYGPQCGADKVAATITTTVVSINGAEIELTPGWSGSLAAIKFLGGIFSWTYDGFTEQRSVLAPISDNVLLLSGPPRGLEAAMAVSITKGCDHQMDDCAALHENILNYGGQPWIPIKSPLGTASPFI